jgi:HD superfamily phosphohydrolase
MHSREIRDPVHRVIGVTEEETRFLDHPFVQRLRYIRQLGFAYLVYPGAQHDRFGHVLGAMHLAGLMWSAVIERDRELLEARFGQANLARFRRLLRLAALMHDLGHAPFSHVAEHFMPALAATAFPAEWTPARETPARRARHEDFSVILMRALCDGPDPLLTPADAQDIASLVHDDIEPSGAWRAEFGADDHGLHALLKSFISGELDCDRMDYLLRDAYMAGTVYGNYDIDRLINGQGVAELDGRLVRYLDATAVRSFEDFLLARYHMFLQVYLHKTTVSFDLSLRQAVERGELELALPGDAAGYAALRDDTVVERLFAASVDGRHEWSRRLVRREPLKLVMVAEAARPEETALMERVRSLLRSLGLESFEVNSRHYLSRAPRLAADGSLFVRRRLLGRHVLDPITSYSNLLTKYNEQVLMTHLYLRRDDWDRAREALTALH